MKARGRSCDWEQISGATVTSAPACVTARLPRRRSSADEQHASASSSGRPGVVGALPAGRHRVALMGLPDGKQKSPGRVSGLQSCHN
jgi:hypothetical protein